MLINNNASFYSNSELAEFRTQDNLWAHI